MQESEHISLLKKVLSIRVPQQYQLIRMPIFWELLVLLDREWAIWILLQPGTKERYGLKYHSQSSLFLMGRFHLMLVPKISFLIFLKFSERTHCWVIQLKYTVPPWRI